VYPIKIHYLNILFIFFKKSSYFYKVVYLIFLEITLKMSIYNGLFNIQLFP